MRRIESPIKGQIFLIVDGQFLLVAVSEIRILAGAVLYGEGRLSHGGGGAEGERLLYGRAGAEGAWGLGGDCELLKDGFRLTNLPWIRVLPYHFRFKNSFWQIKVICHLLLEIGHF